MRENEPCEIYSNPQERSLGYITSNPDRFCELLDKRRAIARGLLTGLFGTPQSDDLEDRLARDVEEIRQQRGREHPSGTFFVFEASGEAAPFQALTRRDSGRFTVVLDPVPAHDIRASYQRTVRAMIVGATIAFEDLQGVHKISEGDIFFEDDGRPCFAFNVEGGMARVVVSYQPEVSQIEQSRAIANAAISSDSFDSVFRLLIQSLDTEPDELTQFLAAWMALEVFINKTFNTYESELMGEFATKVTVPMRDRYISKIKEIMQGEYGFLDRFAVVSGRLCPEDAEADYDAVRPAHKLRNEFSHGVPIKERGLPTQVVQRILRKFLRRHREAQGRF